MSISMLVGWALGEQACSVGPRNKCPVHTNLSEAVHAWKVVPAYDDLLGRRLPKYSSGQPGHRCGTQMSGISSLDVSNLREPILIALVIVLIGYLVAQRFQQTGCPFAPSSAKSTSTAAKQQMASTTGSLRLTLAQLADYDGRDASKPLCISVRGKIYDVTAGRTFYGPGTATDQLSRAEANRLYYLTTLVSMLGYESAASSGQTSFT